MKAPYSVGLIVGKFYPFHKGHEYLIDTALKQSKKLIVMVESGFKQECINAKTRAEWIRETFRGLDVRVIKDIGYDDDSKKWAEYTIKLLGKAPDVVFTSEEYGVTWAQELGCANVQVDLPRLTYPISGTMVRSNPNEYWSMLPRATKSYFTQRIVLIGAESTGKSTLANMLAKYYQTNCVHEYARFYIDMRRSNNETVLSEQKGIELDWRERDFVNIATGQTIIADQLAETANKLLICDTDSFTTHIWHYRYFKEWSEPVGDIAKHSSPLLYLVTPPDIPFDQDGTRDGEHIRSTMHKWVMSALKRNNKSYHIVRGGMDIEARLNDSIKAIDAAQTKWIKDKAWSNL